MNLEKEELLKSSRAWIELDLKALEHNILELTKIIAKDKIMAVVKANAYGHGMIEISKKLEEMGINNYAVATLEEGIELRKSGNLGNILILGYTRIEDLPLVIEYDLIQTIVDYHYAKEIELLSLSKKVKAEIKINTGMNRLGETRENIDKIKEMYSIKNLEVVGIFSHFASADSLVEEDIQFSKKQINDFEQVVSTLKQEGYLIGRVHLQSSYGLLNYASLHKDFARIGIIMYGVHSTIDMEPLIHLDLEPVLSIKARVASVKYIDQNTSVSYGRTYVSKNPMKIATITIGYADGIPRNLSGREVYVKVGTHFARVIGRICMDQMMIDVSNIEEIKQGDVVTIIGKEKLISCEYVSNQATTITNELLSRLGSRLPRVITRQ